MAIFKGAAVAIVTPFHEDKTVNFEKFGELIEDQIAGGTDAIVVCGTTGESSTLTHEEHLEVIKYCVEKVAGRIPVIAGTGSNCTETAIYLSAEAEKYGVDGVLLVTPYYNKATQFGLFQHFKAIADSIKVPCILYNVPSRTGCNIQPETAVRLCTEVENIVGIKEASGDLSYVAKIAKYANENFAIYSGNDDVILPVLSMGGSGVISVLANVMPKETHDMVMSYLNGDTKGALAEQLRLMNLINNLFIEVNPIPVKEAMNLMGMNVGGFRLPLCEMEDEHREILRESMAKVGLV